MMPNNAPPSINPANLNSTPGAFRELFKKLIQDVNGMLPAEVIEFDRVKNLVKVQPLINMVDTNGNQIDRAPIASIPVIQMGAGGFVLNFNLIPGDLGWIQANDRDISLFLQNYKQAGPNTFRIKSFSDAVFFPSILTGYTINEEDEANAVFQSLDGTVRIALWSDKVKISAPTVEIVSTDAIITTQTAEITATTSIDIDSPEITVGGSTSLTINTPEVTVNATTSATVTSPIVEVNATTSATVTSPAINLMGLTTATGGLAAAGAIPTTLGAGGLAIARKGDAVVVNPVTGVGTITGGGLNTSI